MIINDSYVWDGYVVSKAFFFSGVWLCCCVWGSSGLPETKSCKHWIFVLCWMIFRNLDVPWCAHFWGWVFPSLGCPYVYLYIHIYICIYNIQYDPRFLLTTEKTQGLRLLPVNLLDCEALLWICLGQWKSWNMLEPWTLESMLDSQSSHPHCFPIAAW